MESSLGVIDGGDDFFSFWGIQEEGSNRGGCMSLLWERPVQRDIDRPR